LGIILFGLAGTGLLIMSEHILGLGGVISGGLMLALSAGTMLLAVRAHGRRR
jgi:hypothetical protein